MSNPLRLSLRDRFRGSDNEFYHNFLPHYLPYIHNDQRWFEIEREHLNRIDTRMADASFTRRARVSRNGASEHNDRMKSVIQNCDLPLDIVREIFEVAAAVDTRTAASLSSVSQTVQTWVDKHLYHTIYLQTDIQAIAFHHTMVDQPSSRAKNLPQHVRSLVISDCAPLDVPCLFIDLCPHLEAFMHWGVMPYNTLWTSPMRRTRILATMKKLSVEITTIDSSPIDESSGENGQRPVSLSIGNHSDDNPTPNLSWAPFYIPAGTNTSNITHLLLHTSYNALFLYADSSVTSALPAIIAPTPVSPPYGLLTSLPESLQLCVLLLYNVIGAIAPKLGEIAKGDVDDRCYIAVGRSFVPAMTLRHCDGLTIEHFVVVEDSGNRGEGIRKWTRDAWMKDGGEEIWRRAEQVRDYRLASKTVS